MPNQAEHLRAAGENAAAARLLLGSSDPEFPQWVATTVFYTAVHVVEAVFASVNVHSTDHIGRERELKRTRRYQNLWTHYRPLREDSEHARYLLDSGTGPSNYCDYRSLEQVRKMLIGHRLLRLLASAEKLIGDDDFFARVRRELSIERSSSEMPTA